MPSENPPVATELAMVRRHRAIVTNLSRLAAHRGLSPGQFFQELVVRVAQAMEIHHAKLLRYRPEPSDLLVEAGCGWKPGFVGTVAFPADMTSPTGRAFRTGQPVLIEDIGQAEGYHIPESLTEHGICSLANVPIMVDGATWGVLEADSTEPSRFSHDTEELLLSAAALASIVIARARAEQEQQEAVTAQAITLQRHELMLAEMHHRVRNNFQMLLAMIANRKSQFPQAEGRAIAGEWSDAIMAMSLAHEQLSLSRPGDATLVNLRLYLNALAVNLEKSNDGLAIEVESDELYEAVENTVALGLIVNEAVRNAVKHAFPGGRGLIEIGLCETGMAEVCLTVSDNGAGKKNSGQGSGTRLVKALARQIGGQVEWLHGKNGTIVKTVFPRRVQEIDATFQAPRKTKPSEENKRAWGKRGIRSKG